MDIAALQAGYASGELTVEGVLDGIYNRIAAAGERPVWIAVVPHETALARARELALLDRTKLPLYGVPFAVKDNIDVAGMPTTAGCPAFAYMPEQSATVVERLEEAGAILIGKTNMDQFATGLVGTRSPYGACSSVFDAGSISGGSSSGSAVTVASGLVSFALGTDTAGSGRVPAMFNNTVGLKPTRGLVSARGVVPACRTLDCVSIFSQTARDASLVLSVARGADAGDAYSRVPETGAEAAPWVAAATFRFGVPRAESLEFYGDPHNAAMYQEAVAKLVTLGGEAVEFDLNPFVGAARLLYAGPWVAERQAAVGAFVAEHSPDVDSIVAGIVAGGAKYSAADAFRAAYVLEELRRETKAVWAAIDVMVLPTAPRTYTHAEVAEAPIERNNHLGRYTNFVNLLDLAAVAVPAGMRSDGLPFGVSLIGQAWKDAALLSLADRLHRAFPAKLGASSEALTTTQPLDAMMPPPDCLLMAVVGAHLTGQPLNWQLTQRRGRLVRTCRTATDYRFYALNGTVPPKPGLVREPGFAGLGIEVEIWALPADTVGGFVDGVPPPLCIGTLRLEDGSDVKGFLVEPAATMDATEITRFEGWRAYITSLA